MKNKNRTGRQKYIPSDRKCKNCVYNGGKRKGKRVCLADTCIYTVDNCNVTRSVSKMTEIERRGGKRWDKPKKAEKSRDCGGGKF